MKYCLKINFIRKFYLAVAVIVSSISNVQAEDKAAYTLRNPTPVALMRELSTDRPDKTESPYTVDAGHYQLELSFLDYSYDHDIPSDPHQRVTSYTVLPFNFKVGLFNNTDIQFVVNPYISEHTRGTGDSDKHGFGDVQTRVKINLWGNDGGDTAMAVMPFVKFPTNGANLGNDDVEGGIIVPIAFSLPHEWGMGVMTEFDFNRNADNEDYHTEFINTITFGHQIVGNLNGYVEFFSNVSNEAKADWVGTVDAGMTYLLNKDVQLDAGVNVGVTRSAEDLNPFCGLTIRI
ncbi:MAG: hypothetical protein A2787_04085 [Omnitrophica WOR_2 bacterium RIFCSPHIGHO2_01_FULL_48_9]|nr:MAG: hypothetical protein A3D10_07515 [Omnitrophica WOR_2 bacterium RIFCSPHIGHO2_02_FULL_48_11]OGX34193.1 MAG: hypothetical protein A2787_04085 [Omnitrophica WOR_2 bacterium RIFCSPHIGHO2_01_FULL_48_9]